MKKSVVRPYPPSLFWDAEECAYHLGMSPSHWRALVGEGKAPAPVRVHGKVLWPVLAVQAWSHKQAGDAMVPMGNRQPTDEEIEWG